MAISQELILGFQSLNVSLNHRELEKCEELCKTYNIDPEDFVDQWLAYTASNLNGAPPTLEALDKMERKELQRHSRSVKIKTPKAKKRDIEDVSLSTPPRRELAYESPKITQDTPTQQFVERSDSRSVQCEYKGQTIDSETDFKSKPIDSLLIKIYNEDCINSGKYMYEKFLLRREAVNNSMRWVIGEILKYHKLTLTYEKIKEYSGEMVICGRICSDNPGKLNLQSIFLEGTLETYRGQTIKLNVDNLSKFSLFTGQVVVIKGNNMKNRFLVSEIYSGAPGIGVDESVINLSENLEIVVACGPFTLPDNLIYEPLEDLFKYVLEAKPSVLILMGPFLDSGHNLIETLHESYDLFFENIVDSMMQKLKPVSTRVVLIPSTKDVHNHVIFPCLPYKLRRKHPKLILAPNPCVLDIEGLQIGASTADILFHIGKNEISRDSLKKDPRDRMTKLASHILEQRSFYPLSPSDPDIKIDYQLFEMFGLFDKIPDLVILPSNFRHFIKKINGCLVINPERLSKGKTAGTFARIEYRPGTGAVVDRISCQVLRV